MIRSLYISYNGMTEPIVQSQVIPYLRKLSRKNIKFYLLTYEKKKISSEEKKKIRNELLQENIPIEWLALAYHKRPSVPATLFDILTGFILAVFIIIKNRIQVVHARAITAALAGYPAAKLLTKKFIFDTRGIDSEEYVDAGTWVRGSLKHRVVGFLERFLIKTSDHVIVLTQVFLEILKKKFRNPKIKFSVIPCSADTGKFNPLLRKAGSIGGSPVLKNKFVFCYAGSLGTWYMFKEMLEFFKIAQEKLKNSYFLILTQVSKKYAFDEIKKAGLKQADISVDSVSYEMMPACLSASSAGMFFIKPVFSKLSSSPVKFGEYLASGLPVIINRGIGDTENIVRENKIGVIVEDFNEQSYRKALDEFIELLKDDNISQRCRQVAEKYLSLNSAVEEYYNIYKGILNEV